MDSSEISRCDYQKEIERERDGEKQTERRKLYGWNEIFGTLQIQGFQGQENEQDSGRLIWKPVSCKD